MRTYGDVSPGAPRVAGMVLHGCDDPAVPWHRIVRADGSLAKGERQRALLEREGVPFRGGGGSTCASPGCRTDACGSSARSSSTPARAAFTSSPARCAARCRSSSEIGTGLLHLLIQHTSASLTLSENASPDVRRDFESWFNRAVPEGAPYWTHTLEGDDDMPAHIKAALLGPVADAAGGAAGGWRSGPGRGSTCASTATAAASGGSSPTLQGE